MTGTVTVVFYALLIGGALGAWRARRRFERAWALLLAACGLAPLVLFRVAATPPRLAVQLLGVLFLAGAVMAWAWSIPWRGRLLSLVLVWFGVFMMIAPENWHG